MQKKQNKEHSHHWAYGPEGKCVVGKIRRQLEERDDFSSGWQVIAKVPRGGYRPHDVMAFHGEVIYLGRRCRVFFLENWFYRNSNYTTGKTNRYKTEKLYSEFEDIQEYRDCDIDSIVARLNYGCNRSEAELQLCKKWLVEYQVANELSLYALDDFCFDEADWIFEQIYGKET